MKKFYLYDNKELKFKVVSMSDNEKFLEFAYKNIGCDTVDFVSLTEKIDIVVDGEGLIKGPVDSINYVYNRVTNEIEHKLVGKMLFVGFDFEVGDTISLTEEQIDYISNTYIIADIPTGWELIFGE